MISQPFFIFLFLTSIAATSGNVTMFAVARSLYLIRLPRCNGHLQDILRMLSALSPKVFSISPEKLRVGKVVACVCYLAHVTCCAMCLIGVGARARGEENWIEANDYDHLSSLSIYLRAYFWAIYTIVTVGFGSVSVVSSTEKVFAMSVMILGAIMCDAGITAMLSSIIANADKLSGTMRRSEEGMLQFCRSHRYSEDIQGKVTLYYDYVSNKMQNSFEAQDFNLLSLPLKFEFVQNFAFDSLCSLCLLDTEDSDIRLGFVYSLLRHAELTIAIPGQVRYFGFDVLKCLKLTYIRWQLGRLSLRLMAWIYIFCVVEKLMLAQQIKRVGWLCGGIIFKKVKHCVVRGV